MQVGSPWDGHGGILDYAESPRTRPVPETVRSRLPTAIEDWEIHQAGTLAAGKLDITWQRSDHWTIRPIYHYNLSI